MTGGDAELIRTDESSEDHLYIVQESRATSAYLFVRDEVLYDAEGTVLAEGVSRAAWSPDGMEIAYMTTHGTLAVIDAVGGTPRPVAENLDGALSSLYWSPDGVQIAVLFPHTGRETKLMVYNLDKRNEAYELVAPISSWSIPDWRP